MKFALSYILILNLLFSSVPALTKQTTDPVDAVAATVSTYIQHLDKATIRTLLIEHYQVLGLLGTDEQWNDPALQKMDALLLPVLTQADLQAFIETMAKNAKDNHYLLDFLHDPELLAYTRELETSAAKTGYRLFPEVVTLAVALDRLTQAMLADPEVINVCVQLFTEKIEQGWTKSFITPSEYEKLLLVEDYVEKIYQSLTASYIDPDLGAPELRDNISWATNIETDEGLSENAHAGTALSHYHPNVDGKSPPTFSADQTRVLFHPPQPREWADLYVTWNLAFVARDDRFPFLAAKLLIPTVSDYHSQPEGFLHPRLLSLYTYMNYHFFVRMTKLSPNKSYETLPVPQAVLELWGTSNDASALQYRESIPTELR